MAELRLQKGTESRDLSLVPGIHVIGRDPACQILLDSNWVSRRHCQITVDAKGSRLQDLGSSNGTFLNGQKVEQAPLHPGDVIQLGEYRLWFDPPAGEKEARPAVPSWYRLLGRVIQAPLQIKVGVVLLVSFLLFQQLLFQQSQRAARRAMRAAAMQSARRLTLYLAEKNRNNLVLGNYILLDSESVRQEVGVKSAVLANRELKVLSPLAEASLSLGDPQSLAAAQSQTEEIQESLPRADGTVVFTTPIRSLNAKEGVYQTVGVARLVFSPGDYIDTFYSETEVRLLSLLLSLALALGLTVLLSRFFSLPLAKLRLGLEGLENLPEKCLAPAALPREVAPLAELINYRLQKERGRFAEGGGAAEGSENLARQDQLDRLAGLEKVIGELIGSAPLGAALLDSAGRVKTINDRALEILEINRRDFQRPLSQVLAPPFNEGLQRLIEENERERRETAQAKVPHGGVTVVLNISTARNLLGVPLYHLLIVEKL